MKFASTTLAIFLTATTVTTSTDAFAPIRSNTRVAPFLIQPVINTPTTALFESTDGRTDMEEIERLRSMAAKLRAEASSLEAERAKSFADAAEKAFRTFDTNQDGQVSVEELKQGLENMFKMEVSQERAESLMKAFDSSGDGALQLEEFVTVDQFMNKLEALAREERQAAVEKQRLAQEEAVQATAAEARLTVLNDRAPTTTDRVLSTLPYLLPLFDGLQFGKFLLQNAEDNPITILLAVLYSLFKSIPFSGFVSFLALNVLSSNPGINRLVRYNMQQAIYVDIALFFPSLFGGIFGIILGENNPQGGVLLELGSDAIFAALLLTLSYCVISSLLGVAPDKVPIISGEVDKRVLSVDMFDEQGQFIPPSMRAQDEEKDEDKKEEEEEEKKDDK